MTDTTPVCAECREPMSDPRFTLCRSCTREIRGPFEFERDDSNEGDDE